MAWDSGSESVEFSMKTFHLKALGFRLRDNGFQVQKRRASPLENLHRNSYHFKIAKGF